MNRRIQNIAGTLLILIVTIPLSGQHRTWLSLEGGPKWDYSQEKNADPVFLNSHYASPSAGIALWQELGRVVSIGTGAYWMPLYEGFRVRDHRPGSAGQPLLNTLQIPLRLAFRYQMEDRPFYLSFQIGYLASIALDTMNLLSGNSQFNTSEQDVVSFSYSSTATYFSLMNNLEAGLKGGFLIGNNWEVSLGMLWHLGLREFNRSGLNYTATNGLTGLASYSSRGSNFQLNAALMIPLSNIWANRDFRIRSKIENSLYRGKDTDQANTLYFGATAGSFWKTFNYTNTALTARPPSHRGIFRYASFETGAYIGYMFTGRIGADIGAYYLPSSLFFSAAYDQENSTAVKVPAPFFLEVPLRVRYLHDLYRQQLFLVFSAGGSMLLQFAGPAYATGQASFTYPDLSGGSASGSLSYTGNRTSMFGGRLILSAGAEYRIPIKFPLVVSADIVYNQGFTEIDQIQISTSLPENPSVSEISWKGSGWRADIGVKIPVKLGQKGKNKCGALPRVR
ncbi:MAG: hypothetical protein ACOYXB_06680 [Bacteroidota bacterium]